MITGLVSEDWRSPSKQSVKVLVVGGRLAFNNTSEIIRGAEVNHLQRMNRFSFPGVIYVAAGHYPQVFAR